jgi:hypothetical protein
MSQGKPEDRRAALSSEYYSNPEIDEDDFNIILISDK